METKLPGRLCVAERSDIPPVLPARAERCLLALISRPIVDRTLVTSIASDGGTRRGTPVVTYDESFFISTVGFLCFQFLLFALRTTFDRGKFWIDREKLETSIDYAATRQREAMQIKHAEQ